MSAAAAAAKKDSKNVEIVSDDDEKTLPTPESDSDDSDSSLRHRWLVPKSGSAVRTPPRTSKSKICPPAPPRPARRQARPVIQQPRRLFAAIIVAAADGDVDESKHSQQHKPVQNDLKESAIAPSTWAAAAAATETPPSWAETALTQLQSSVYSWGAPAAPQEDTWLIAPDPAAFTKVRSAKRKSTWATRAATRTGTRSDKRRKASPPTPHSSPSK